MPGRGPIGEQRQDSLLLIAPTPVETFASLVASLLERRWCELRRIPLPCTSVNMGKKRKGRAPSSSGPI